RRQADSGRQSGSAEVALPDKPISRWLGIALLLVIATVFGANHVAARVAMDHGANVTTAVAVRSGGTVIFVLALLLLGGVPLRLPRARLGGALAIGALLAVQSYCLYSAVALIPVALALLAFNTFPMLLALMSWAAGGERPSPRALAAMPVALAGLALALDVWGGSGAHFPGFAGRWAEIGAGVLWATGGAVSFALVLYLTSRWLKDMDGRLRTLYMMLAIVSLMLAGGALAGDFALPRDGTGWAGLVLLTLFYASAITALFVVLPRLGAVDNAMVLNFEPIAVLAIAWVVLDQSVTPLQILGAFVVVGAIMALGSGRR
ncbi:MAG: DMT family transporter, partial [Burkholderiales bacterium]